MSNSVGMWFKVPAGSTAGGVLYSYGKTSITDPHAGDGPFGAADVVALYLADLNGDGKADLIERSTDGNLYAWPNTGGLASQTFGTRRVIGNGWNSSQIVSIFFADLNNDGKADLIKQTTDGLLSAFPNVDGINFSWGALRTIGAGWNSSQIVNVFFADLNNDGKACLLYTSPSPRD